jgi:hypothetical protein
MNPITDKERKEYVSILLELCASYGIKPSPELFTNLDTCIKEQKQKYKESHKYAKKLGKIIGQRIDQIIYDEFKNESTLSNR